MDWVEADAMHQGRHEDGDYRRIEVITGKRRRRNWTAEEKARIVAESAKPGASIAGVARRWGVNRGLLTVWRRQVGLVQASPARGAAAGLHFVPITIAENDRSVCRGLDCKCWITILQKRWRNIPHLSGSAISRAGDGHLHF